MPKKPSSEDHLEIGVDLAAEGTDHTAFFFPNIGQGIAVDAGSFEEALAKATKIQSDFSSPMKDGQ